MSLGSEPLQSLKAALKSFSDDVVVPGDAQYDELIRRWNATAEKRAGAVVLPTSAEAISATINVARNAKVPFVVAGGRHALSGSSSVEGGIVIDLRKMRSVKVDPEKKIIVAQGGCVWKDVDEEAAKYGLAMPGGTVNHTGIGGLTLGGGYGYLSGRYGLVIDILISVQMVLASGEIVTVSEDSYPDLWWAIRGCGSSFGVAVEFTYKAFEQGPVWSGVMGLSPDKLPQVVEFANKFEKTNNGDQVLFIGFGAPPPAFQPAVLVIPFYNGSPEEAEEFFADLLAIESLMKQVGPVPYEALNGMLNDASGSPGGRRTGGASAVALPLDPAWVQQIWDMYWANIQGPGVDHDANESLLLFELVPYQKSNAVKFDSTAHANRGEYYNVGTAFKWSRPELDSQLRGFGRELHRRIRDEGGTKAMRGVGAYSNYVEDTTPEKVFGSNTPRLVEVKRKYDPLNLFYRWHNVLPEGW